MGVFVFLVSLDNTQLYFSPGSDCGDHECEQLCRLEGGKPTCYCSPGFRQLAEGDTACVGESQHWQPIHHEYSTYVFKIYHFFSPANLWNLMLRTVCSWPQTKKKYWCLPRKTIPTKFRDQIYLDYLSYIIEYLSIFLRSSWVFMCLRYNVRHSRKVICNRKLFL